ncbi:MAG TPA: PAS domain-containing protein [Alphaproteobacteria bacterium]|nr:PAS domain-containing protein [Alphaproteobacteria bacterium]
MSQRFNSPVLQEVYDYWSAKRGERAMPARSDLDPHEMKKALPHLMLTDVLDGGSRFRYRLVGTAIAEAFGRDMTGLYIDEVMSDGRYRDFILGLYRDLVEKRRPIYSESRYYSERKVGLSAERLMLPLSSDGTVVDMVLAAQVFKHDTPLRTLSVRLAQERQEEIQHLTKLLDE